MIFLSIAHLAHSASLMNAGRSEHRAVTAVTRTSAQAVAAVTAMLWAVMAVRPKAPEVAMVPEVTAVTPTAAVPAAATVPAVAGRPTVAVHTPTCTHPTLTITFLSQPTFSIRAAPLLYLSQLPRAAALPRVIQ